MASPLGSEDEIFETLKRKVDPKVEDERIRAADERERAYNEKNLRRLGDLVEVNRTLPCTISSIRVLHADHTRRGFLERIFNPLLSVNQDRPYTFAGLLKQVAAEADKLRKFDIFQPNSIDVLIHPAQVNPASKLNDLDIYFNVQEKSRFFLQTGTDVGNAEGSAYGNMRWRNVFGGAETLNLNASLGTRTRFAYQASLDTPFLSNPDFRGEIGGLASSTQKPWSSHEEVAKGGWAKLRWIARGGGRHELGYHGVWRQITGLASNASPSVRNEAGDSVKSSITHTWITDQRDYPLLPSRGYYAKSTSEIAGWGPLQGDVAFWKSEVEAQGAVPIPVPGVKGDSGVSFTSGLRAGVLYPLPLGFESKPETSRLNDRFHIGGPADVRGFRLSGLGPRDGADALGGDVYAAGSANLLLPIPRVGPDKPLRFQAFVNGGRLLALKQSEKRKDGTSPTISQNVYSTIAELANGLPSMSAGVGLVYAHPAARFELNFSLPLVIRQGEEGRKGLQFGIGINML